MTEEELNPKNSNDNKGCLIEAIVYSNDENSQFSTEIILGVFLDDFSALDACKAKLKNNQSLIAYTTRPVIKSNLL